jgi:hypothetical protein
MGKAALTKKKPPTSFEAVGKRLGRVEFYVRVMNSI